MNVQRLGALGVLAIVVSCTVLRAQEPAVLLENADFSCRLGSTGRILGFIDRRTGRDYCAQPGIRPCLTVTKRGVCYEPTACSYDGSKLSLGFGPAGAEIVVNVSCKGRYLVLEIASVSDPQVEQVELSNASVGSERSDTTSRVASCIRAGSTP
jgi:hypothetical protein